MQENLLQHIRKFVAIDDADWNEIASYFKVLHLKKKEFLLEEGKICKYQYFVANGCLRMFFRNEKEMEKTVQFGLENWWIADYFSFVRQTPSDFYIQSVLASEVWAISFEAQEHLTEKFPIMEKYFRIIHQTAHAASQRKTKHFYSLSKEEIFRQFCNSFPDFVQKIPQYMLASYLDITPEYLSELRAKLVS